VTLWYFASEPITTETQKTLRERRGRGLVLDSSCKDAPTFMTRRGETFHKFFTWDAELIGDYTEGIVIDEFVSA
jgi:hypothetical protein